jgi:quinol monooxygenase YgiN
MQTEEGIDLDKQMGSTCVATFLPLKSWKYMISFQMMTSKVLKQVRKSKGVVNYAVKANFRKKHFWTLSNWKDKDSLRQFLIAEPHVTAVNNFKVWAGEGSAFVEWTSESDTIDWTEALKKLQNPTFYYKTE